jgi:hypothetical protein
LSLSALSTASATCRSPSTSAAGRYFSGRLAHSSHIQSHLCNQQTGPISALLSLIALHHPAYPALTPAEQNIIITHAPTSQSIIEPPRRAPSSCDIAPLGEIPHTTDLPGILPHGCNKFPPPHAQSWAILTPNRWAIASPSRCSLRFPFTLLELSGPFPDPCRNSTGRSYTGGNSHTVGNPSSVEDSRGGQGGWLMDGRCRPLS